VFRDCETGKFSRFSLWGKSQFYQGEIVRLSCLQSPRHLANPSSYSQAFPMSSPLAAAPLLLLLALTASAADEVRCNTYLGSAFSQSGAGIETCLMGHEPCVQQLFHVLGVETYSMSCDDYFRCPDDIGHEGFCCTINTPQIVSSNKKMIVKCSSTNFETWNVGPTDFPASCYTMCPGEDDSGVDGGSLSTSPNFLLLLIPILSLFKL